MKREIMEKRLMLMDLGELMKKTDKEYQLLRRLQESDHNGVVRCISCGAFHHYKRVDAGHFIPRAHKGTRYERINVWPQCKRCNYYLSGNHAKYRDELIKKISKDGVEELERKKDEDHWGPRWSWREFCIANYFYSKVKIKKELKRVL